MMKGYYQKVSAFFKIPESEKELRSQYLDQRKLKMLNRGTIVAYMHFLYNSAQILHQFYSDTIFYKLVSFVFLSFYYDPRGSEFPGHFELMWIRVTPSILFILFYHITRRRILKPVAWLYFFVLFAIVFTYSYDSRFFLNRPATLFAGQDQYILLPLHFLFAYIMLRLACDRVELFLSVYFTAPFFFTFMQGAPGFSSFIEYLTYIRGSSLFLSTPTIVLLAIYGWYAERSRYREFLDQELMVRELRQSDYLIRLSRLKDDFLANTSHELRTPLNGIVGLAESMIIKADEEERKQLNSMIRNGKRLNYLVNDILDATKLKQKEIHPDFDAVDLHSLVNDVNLLLTPLAEEKSIDLRNQVPQNIQPIFVDADRILQVLSNLITNGIKFTDSGSVSVSATIQDEMMQVTVSDTGVGIDSSNFESIFQIFERGENRVDKKYGGTGLGLGITKQLIELHGGAITVKSEPGGGSDFIFTLPLFNKLPDKGEKKGQNKNMSTVIQPKDEYEKNIWSAFHILIVDDDPINLAVLEKQLLSNDYQVSKAKNGPEALRFLEQQKPDMMLLDIMMPGMNGFQVCREIRKQYNLSEFPIIFLSARAEDRDLLQGFQNGGNDYLTKPFSGKELQIRIQTQLQLLNEKRREQTLYQFTEEMDRFQSVEDIIDMIYETLAHDPFLIDVCLLKNREEWKQLHGSIQDFPILGYNELKRVEENNTVTLHLQFPEQFHIAVQFNDFHTEEWVKAMILRFRKSLEAIREIAYDPVITPAFSLVGSLFDDLLFIQSNGNYCLLHTENRVEEVKISMKNILHGFPTLIPVHRSYCINPKKITGLEQKGNSWLFQLNEKEIPIGKTWLGDIKRAFPHLFESSSTNVRR